MEEQNKEVKQEEEKEEKWAWIRCNNCDCVCLVPKLYAIDPFLCWNCIELLSR